MTLFLVETGGEYDMMFDCTFQQLVQIILNLLQQVCEIWQIIHGFTASCVCLYLLGAKEKIKLYN